MRANVKLGRRMIFALVACIGLAPTQALLAQRVSHEHSLRYLDPDKGLTIDELVILALRRSPSAAAAQDRIAEAKAELDQAGRQRPPSLSFEQREQAGGQDRQTSVALMWPLDVFRKTGRTTVASAGIDAATQAAADRERRLATEVQTRAIRLLAALHHLEVREDVVDANRQIAALTAERVTSGIAPAVERDAVRIEAQLSEVEVWRERAVVEEAAAALRAAIGLDPRAPLVLKHPIDEVLLKTAPPAARSLTIDSLQNAVNARPDVREAEAEVARQTARRDLASREGKADVALAAGYMRTASGFPQFGLTPGPPGLVPTPIEGTFHMITFGATVSLPWSNRNQGAVAAAAAGVKAAGHERDARRIGAQNEIAALVERESHARGALDLFDAGLRELASRNLEVLRESYKLGRATLLDVLAETRRYLDVEMAYADAQLELALARIALAGALGEVK